MTDTTTSEPRAPTVELLEEPDWDQAGALMYDAAAELGNITDSSPIGADIRHLNRAADFCDEAAELFVGTSSEIYYGYLT